MDIVVRPAARVLCVDAAYRVLLMLWRDRLDGNLLWEPPGGGIEAGERPLDAARRELAEETGWLIPDLQHRYVMVPRNVVWNGKRFVGAEAFFVLHIDEPQPLTFDGLTERETEGLQDHRWVPWNQFDLLPETVEPPNIPSILADLDPYGPWA